MNLRATVLGLAALLLAMSGCSTDTELGGVKVPNSRPDTRITGQPPTLLEAGFSVEFHWTASDPDSKIRGYQWKISDNGVDGISVRDTITFDPVTGAELNPWRFTQATDSTFVVLADQPGFPSDEGSTPRSYRTHTIFVRAVDEQGAVDPSPAQLSFTSTTIVPRGNAVFPGLGGNRARDVPPTVNIGWWGEDADFEQKNPIRVRYLWRPAIASDGTEITVRSQYDRYYEELVDFEDPTYWRPWIRYEPDEEDRIASFELDPEVDLGDHYLFAVQFEDTAGAVSVGRKYGIEVGNVVITAGTGPAVQMQENFLGDIDVNDPKAKSVAAGQPLSFAWRADASTYNGNLVSMQHGWDVLNVDNPQDPGWMVAPGLSEQNRSSEPRSFQDGAHTFYLRIIDDSRTVKLIELNFEAVPYIPRDSQAELLVIDQINDRNNNGWIDREGNPRNDESFRNPWWEFLAQDVAGVNWEEDRFDHTDPAIGYEDIVGYKAVLCYARYYEEQPMFRKFRSEDGVDIEGRAVKKDKYVWLTPYQERGGNLFLVGEKSMHSFLENEPRYMVPLVFNTNEADYQGGNQTFTTSFGDRELPDGTEIWRGPLQYPYATAGIATIDWTSPSSKYVYARPARPAKDTRRVECVGLKGLVLDTAFKEYHGVGPSDFRDTIMTETAIDWHDEALAVKPGGIPILTNLFPWRDDEFVDSDISSRQTVWQPQDCDDPAAPNGKCVEPMFRGLARFDWLREYWWSKAENPDIYWPDPDPDQDPPFWSDKGPGARAMTDTCGGSALESYLRPPEQTPEGYPRQMTLGTAKTNGKVFGFFSYKMTQDKPGGRPDVYWGFDPYRFDHEQIKDAIRWVLGRNFGLNVTQ